jgi:2-succinyl-5-enolpyruvyl-6-hydroxy-3-cyclohexene-1-carboxylate synthase
MTAPNRATLWGESFVDELARLDVDVAFAPGSRSTPLVVAAHRHPGVETFSHLDERCGAFFALGRGRRTGRPTAVVCTSGTAAANFHPAAVEADRGRVPLLLVTADRPPELADSGANQTIDQEKLYGDAVRWYHDFPEPEPDARKLRSLRTSVARAVSEATTAPAGPVHCNVRFRKPLEPTDLPGDVPESLAEDAPVAVGGRPDGEPYVRPAGGSTRPDDATVDRMAAELRGADRPLVVAGPADPRAVGTAGRGDGDYADRLVDLAAAVGAPLLADPLSGVRFSAGDRPQVLGGYDAYLDPAVVDGWPDPGVVVRVGASPTSKVLRKYLAGTGARQYVVDPAGGWREAEFAATDLVVADPDALAADLAARLGGGTGGDSADGRDGSAGGGSAWVDRFRDAERAYWDLVGDARDEETFEGAVLAAVAEAAPAPSTVFVSNSMPVRDVDRFGRPREGPVTVLGNRGASGIDGVVSTALGAGSATADPLVLVAGDLAYYHDMNGLLALGRLGVDATVVVVNNDGGGIFHMLPIEAFDPPFTEAFVTPHGLDFEPTADLYDLTFERVDPDGFPEAFASSVGDGGATVIEVAFDSAASHRTREAIQERVVERLG